MLHEIHPKLPMRDKAATRDFYLNQLGFTQVGTEDYEGYLMVEKDHIQIHFFEFKDLDPYTNYGQVYIRVTEIQDWYASIQAKGVRMPAGNVLELKPWRQWEFSVLDPDHNLLTFGQEE